MRSFSVATFLFGLGRWLSLVFRISGKHNKSFAFLTSSRSIEALQQGRPLLH